MILQRIAQSALGGMARNGHHHSPPAGESQCEKTTDVSFNASSSAVLDDYLKQSTPGSR